MNLTQSTAKVRAEEAELRLTAFGFRILDFEFLPSKRLPWLPENSQSAILNSKSAYHRISAEAHVNPLPNAARQIRSPSFIRPSAQASLIAMGIDAAVVFP